MVGGSAPSADGAMEGRGVHQTTHSRGRGARFLRTRSLVPALALVAGALVVPAVRGAAAPQNPAFVQQVSAHSSRVTSLGVTPAAAVASGDRLVVEVGVWNSSGSTASSVTDSAGNTYTEVLHFVASDRTELSVWTAPISLGAGTKPTVTAHTAAAADIGIGVVEYSGLSSVPDASAVDTTAHASGTSKSAGAVASGATAPATLSNELAVGFYADSGFGDALTAGAGFTSRVNVSPASDMELLTEDQLTNIGVAANASVNAGVTTWLMGTVVFKVANGVVGAPGTPGQPTATGANASASLTWAAPVDGGSPITSYTVTPYIGTSAQSPTIVSGTPPPTTTTIGGLTNGTAYSFTVAATNAVGTGPESAQSNIVTPSPVPLGQWSSLMTWPMVSVHSILLNNGNVAQWDGWSQPEPTQVWNPSTQSFTNQTAPDSIFCSGTARLPDGRILVVGGYGLKSTGQLGIVDTTIFDPTTSTWSRVANMAFARWYPTLTELSDGRYVVISGNTSDESHWADTPEVYDPTTNTWTQLSTISTSQVHELEYPFSYLVPNGDVFTIAPSVDKSFLLNVNAPSWTQVGGTSGVLNGSSVMYRPGEILYSGGASSITTNVPAQTTTAVLDLNAPTPAWRQTAPMQNPRIYHTLTMLADGTVLAVGGATTSDQVSTVTTGTLPTEIWNPTSETWSAAAPIAAARNYHSTALLMPDGTVLVGGGGHVDSGTGPGQFSSQIYSPPYLFNGPRPTITAMPSSANYGNNISVTTPDAASITGVNLVSLGADTHQIDMDQHFVPLSFTAGAGSLQVQLPASAALAPPGTYMLFLVNNKGVPSIAGNLHLDASTQLSAPGAPSGVSAVAGNGTATVSWSAPANGGSPITSYTVTPYIGTTAQTPVTVSGNPPATSTLVSGLTNGTAYTFTVTATNAIGTGPPSTPSSPVTPTAATATPAFVQQIGAHSGRTTSLSIIPTNPITNGNRLIVEVGVWGSGSPTASAVTDSAGNTYVELVHYTAADHTELSIWTAPITKGAGTRPTITITPTAAADLGAIGLEYSGLSTVADNTIVDQLATATGKTTTAATVSSGNTAAATANNELALGFYADSGFGDTLTPGTNWTQRANLSPFGDMELLTEDQPINQNTTTASTTNTGANTTWLQTTLILKHA